MVLQRVSDDPYRISYSHLSVASVANQIRKVDDRFINAQGNHVTDDCCRYLLPLIQGEVKCIYRDGFPVHLTIR